MTAAVNNSTGVARLRMLTWWTMVGCLAVVVALVGAELAGVRAVTAKLAAVAALLLVCAVAGRLFAVAVLGRPRPRTVVLVSLVILAGLAAGSILMLSRAVASGGFPWALPLAALIAAVWVGAGWRWQLVWPAGIGLASGASLCGSWWAGAISGRGAVVDTAIVALCVGSLYAQVWVLDIGVRLDRARRLESAAAVTDERLRFAADLHDIQGHSLQVIALKSELAERLVAADGARAAAEMRDVQALARQALDDTREVVRGYRAVSLDTEIRNATRVLRAAGIECSLSQPADLPALPAQAQNLLGLVVRECTTNVLRHSAAEHCDVSIAVDDGNVLLRFANDAPLDEPCGPAGGLAGLAERLATAGGRLVVRNAQGSFTVSAYLPGPASR